MEIFMLKKQTEAAKPDNLAGGSPAKETAPSSASFKALCLICSIFTSLALAVNPDVQEGANGLLYVIQAFGSLDIADAIIFILLFYFYRHAFTLYLSKCRPLREKLCRHIPAVLFAAFMVLGYSFYADNSWNLVFGNSVQFFKSCVALIGWYALFLCCIVCLFDLADRLPSIPLKKITLPRPVQYYFNTFQKHPFLTCFLTILIVYLPYIVMSYPGILTHDTKTQLSNAIRAMDGQTALRNQHPITHSLLMYFFTKTGQALFGSANVGIFLYSLFQFLLLTAAFSWFIKLLVELKVPYRVIAFLIVFFTLAPTTQNYMFICVKDVPYTAFLIFFLIELFRLTGGYYDRSKGKKLHVLLLVLSALGMFLFRQDGIYLLLATFLGFLISSRKNRRFWSVLMIGFLCLFIFWQNILIPGFQIKPCSRRMMLSIPFQQTARYVRDAGSEVTEEEAEAISAILDYENLAELYNPNLSNQVKGTFNEDATTADLAAYFRVWFQMLLKHPEIYVQATMNNYYGYFYPNGWPSNVTTYSESEEQMDSLNESLSDYGLDFHYPSGLTHIRNLYEAYREAVFSIPVLSYTFMPAFYVWALILWLFYCLSKRRYISVRITMPLFIALLTSLAAPAYGWYFRYLFAISVCLPGIIVLELYARSDPDAARQTRLI